MPSKKKKYNSRFPPARIKKIMQSDDEVGKVAQVVPIIISKALEIFVESLLRSSSDITRSRNARTLTPNHIKTSILASEQFKFLRDIANSIPDVNPGAEADDEESGAATPTGGPQGGPFQRRASAATTSGHQLSAAGQSAAAGFRTRGRPRKRLQIDSQSSLRSMTSNEEPDDSDETEEDDDDDDDGEEEEEAQQSTNSDKNNPIVTNQPLIHNNNHKKTNNLSDYYYSSSQTSNPSPYVSTIQSIASSSSATLKANTPVIEEDDDYDN